MIIQEPLIDLLHSEPPLHGGVLACRQRQVLLRSLPASDASRFPGTRLAWAVFGILAGVVVALAGVVAALVYLLLNRPAEKTVPRLWRPLPRWLQPRTALRIPRLHRAISSSIPRVTFCPCSGSWSVPRSGDDRQAAHPRGISREKGRRAGGVGRCRLQGRILPVPVGG